MYTVIELCKLRARCRVHEFDAAFKADAVKADYWARHAEKLTAMIAS